MNEHEVRIHLNLDEGARWWAESDSGFVGATDDLHVLTDSAIDWATEEGFLDALTFRLINPTETATQHGDPYDESHVQVTYEPPYEPILPDPSLTRSRGPEVTRVGPYTIPQAVA